MGIRCSSCLLTAYCPPLKGAVRNSKCLDTTKHCSALTKTSVCYQDWLQVQNILLYKLPWRKLFPSQLNAVQLPLSATRKRLTRFLCFSSYLCIVLSNILASTNNIAGVSCKQRCRSSLLPWVEQYVLLGAPMPGLNLSTAALHEHYLLKAGVDHHKGERKSTPFTFEN